MKLLCNVMFLLCLLTVVSLVDECEANYCAQQTYVFFGNGMFNEQTSAADPD